MVSACSVRVSYSYFPLQQGLSSNPWLWQMQTSGQDVKQCPDFFSLRKSLRCRICSSLSLSLCLSPGFASPASVTSSKAPSVLQLRLPLCQSCRAPCPIHSDLFAFISQHRARFISLHCLWGEFPVLWDGTPWWG